MSQGCTLVSIVTRFVCVCMRVYVYCERVCVCVCVCIYVHISLSLSLSLPVSLNAHASISNNDRTSDGSTPWCALSCLSSTFSCKCTAISFPTGGQCGACCCFPPPSALGYAVATWHCVKEENKKAIVLRRAARKRRVYLNKGHPHKRRNTHTHTHARTLSHSHSMLVPSTAPALPQLVPVTHWATLPHTDPSELELFLPRVLVSYVLMAFGLVFYLSKLPERSCPGMAMQKSRNERGTG